MITKITGIVNRVLDEEARLQIGAFEYQVLVPEYIRRQLQMKVGQEVTLHTSEYVDGNPMQGKLVPRLVGFPTEAELEFFDLFCTVDKVGTKKATKALVRPIRDIADAIQRQDAKWLTALPGIGPATAEQMVATLRRKMTKFAFLPDRPEPDGTATSGVDAGIMEEAYQALLHMGHGPLEARNRLDQALSGGQKFTSVEEIIRYIYRPTA